MSKSLLETCRITTGKLDSNAATLDGKYPFFTCAPDPLRIDNYAFDDDVILLAGNNAQGNFHIARYNGKFNAYQRTYVITAKDKFDIDYVKYSIELSLNHLKKVAQGSQTKFLTRGILEQFKVNDIPYSKQKEQVSCLVSIDKKIALNNRLNATLEAMAKTLYDYWFVQFDFPDEKGRPYKTSGGKMVYNEELGREIPAGWEVAPLTTVCKIVDCLHSQKPDQFYESEKFFLLQLENIVPLGLVDIRNKYYVKSADYELWTSKIEIQEGDLLITNAGRVGAFSRVPKGIRAGIGRNITAIRPQQISAIYFYYYLHSVDCKRQIRLNTDVGAFFDSLNVKGLKNMYVLLPPKHLMQLFDKQGGHCRERLESAAQESERLVALRDWLLPMLMNGQVGFRNK